MKKLSYKDRYVLAHGCVIILGIISGFVTGWVVGEIVL